MLEHLSGALPLLFTIENILWINLGVFIGAVFAAIPGLSVILCVILFLPVTYELTAIPGMMFLLGIYCAGSYAGSISAILINTPGTPHATATMLDGFPLSQKGRTRAALKIALWASTIGGSFSALMLLVLGPEVARISSKLGTPEYFMVCLFGLCVISAVSGKSMAKGLISACLGLFLSGIGTDPITGYDRLTFGIERLYLGLDLAVCLIGLFALVEIMSKAELPLFKLKAGLKKENNADHLSKAEKKRLIRPIAVSSLIGVIVGIIPGTGASEASWISYSQAKSMSSHSDEFGRGSIEGVAAAESANNAVTGATLIPLLTLGIPGDATVAIMLSALMINGLNPGISLFTTDGDIMYAIMLGLILVNFFMFLQGSCLMHLFSRILAVPQEILCPIITLFCLAGAYSINKSWFDVAVALCFALGAWAARRLELPVVPILLGLILGNMTETNFRRALLLSDGQLNIFVSSYYCLGFLVLIVLALIAIFKAKKLERRHTAGT